MFCLHLYLHVEVDVNLNPEKRIKAPLHVHVALDYEVFHTVPVCQGLKTWVMHRVCPCSINSGITDYYTN